MKYSFYQHSFVILGWLIYVGRVEKCAARQKEIGNHRFQKKRLPLVSLVRLAGLCEESEAILTLLNGLPSSISTGKL